MSVKGNWEELILESIDKLEVDNKEFIKPIQDDIKQCYCFEFIDRTGYDYLLLLLNEKIKNIKHRREVYHEQRMYEIHEVQRKMREEKEIKDLLIKADDKWRKANVRRGRPPK